MAKSCGGIAKRVKIGGKPTGSKIKSGGNGKSNKKINSVKPYKQQP